MNFDVTNPDKLRDAMNKSTFYFKRGREFKLGLSIFSDVLYYLEGDNVPGNKARKRTIRAIHGGCLAGALAMCAMQEAYEQDVEEYNEAVARLPMAEESVIKATATRRNGSIVDENSITKSESNPESANIAG